MSLVVACTGGGGSGPGGDDDDDHCAVTATLSGGLRASFRGGSAACAYTSQSVSLTELGGGGVVMNLTFLTLEAGKTGTFPATIEVSQRSGGVTERWLGAKCSIDVTSNVKLPGNGADAGTIAFDNYLIKGSGSCSTSATQVGDAGAKDPVAISPFTFSLLTLFY